MRRYMRVTQHQTLFIIGVVVLLGVGVPVFFFNLTNTRSPIVIADVQPTAVAVPFTKLTQGTQTVVAKRVNYILTSPAELNELWKTVDAPGNPPQVDFRTHAVIAVFAGLESSSSISIAKIEDTDARMVSIAIAKPDGPCAKQQLTASPYEIVAVPATTLPLAHEDLATTASCPK